MEGYFEESIPEARDILLVESGSPHILPKALVALRRLFPEARAHLCTCWPQRSEASYDSVYRVADYPSWRDKLRLLFFFRRSGWPVLGIICSKEPVMYTWKVLALLLVPAKTVVINENGDFFWLDWKHRDHQRRFLAARWVVMRKEFLLTVLRAVVFPFTVLYLLATASFLYARRWRRLLLRKLGGGGSDRLAAAPPPPAPRG